MLWFPLVIVDNMMPVTTAVYIAAPAMLPILEII